MNTNVTISEVKVEITLTAGELLSLDRHGEVLAHTNDENTANVAITTSLDTADLYEDTGGATAVVASDSELMALADGEQDALSWTLGRGTSEEPCVNLYLE